MPRIYECTYRIRHYECDAYGHVNHANYLRYLQEAAYEASADAGYDMVGYRALECLWFIRETEIEYLRPLYYGEEVVVRTWVEDFHRVRSIRAYEIRVAGTDELAARAWSDWVYLEIASGKPRSVPAEMVQAFLPGEEASASRPRRRFPAAPPPPSGAFCMRRNVEWRDLDALQHVNNAVYFSYLEECAMQSGQKFGWTFERLLQEKFGIVARRAQIEYRLPATLGETLEIETWISDVRAASVTRHFVVRRPADGEVICLAHLGYVWVNRETGRPVRIPAHFLQDFAPHIAEDSN